MSNTVKFYRQISVLRERYYKALPGKEALVRLILETEVAEQVYNSNAIENSTLSIPFVAMALKLRDVNFVP